MSKTDDVNGLTQLGSQETKYNYSCPSKDVLETFHNQYPYRQYITEFTFNEFTSLCPKTGQPDFATITVRYIPNKECIETKSLKLYFLMYRQHGSFMETIVNQIFEDLSSVCNPQWMQIIGEFNARGGTKINVQVEM
jgi:7-cyano-7-deazaguanine reductase